jgi:HK97 family phage prohead protease
VLEGYGAIFGNVDKGGDIVLPGAFEASLGSGQQIKILWQHDPYQPIGVWDEVKEDEKGLYVKGRILIDVAKGREALALITAGAMDGLSIGYRTVKASRDEQGNKRGRDGKLGVIAQMPTLPTIPSGPVQANAEFNWTGDMIIHSDSDQPQEVGAEVTEQMRAMFQQMFNHQIGNAMRAGGVLDQKYQKKSDY